MCKLSILPQLAEQHVLYPDVHSMTARVRCAELARGRTGAECLQAVALSCGRGFNCGGALDCGDTCCRDGRDRGEGSHVMENPRRLPWSTA